MAHTTDLLMSIRRIARLYEGMLKKISGRYQLTPIEANIISFLQNNPGKDTAADIVELRMLSKGAVSQAVESLIQKSLLQRRQDTVDRRKIHLSILPAARPITEEIDALRLEFREIVFSGFTEEERELFFALNDRIMANTKSALERGESV